MKLLRKILLALFCLIVFQSAYSQVELVPPSHPVYAFLKRMQLAGIIDYNSANIPVSREKVSGFLQLIKNKYQSIPSIDKDFYDDYSVEFSYDMDRSMKSSVSLLSDFKGENIFSNDKRKYLYSSVDSNVSFFLDINGSLSQRNSDGDSLGINSILLGEAGLRLRGTLFNSVGFYLRLSNGQKIKGKEKDVRFAAATDPKLRANTKFVNEQKNFDSFEGYLRYQTTNDWLSVTLGREAVYNGFGYIDRLFLSNNTVPYDFLRLDLGYKSIKYSFLYGSIKGDSLGMELSSKSIASHRFDVKFSDKFRMGFWESVIITSSPFSFTYLNPISFLTSADLNSGTNSTTANNSLLGLDVEVVLLKNIALQSSLLMDDFNLESLGKNDKSSNDNKFGWQIGTIWSNAFWLPNLTFAMEFTHLDPFVYSHRSNKNTFTHWGMSLGHALPPNSDEIAAKLVCNVSRRLRLDFLYQYQRSGEGLLFDSTGSLVVNYGGYINRGDGDYFLVKNAFLNGNRINQSILTINAVFEPIRQYFIELKYQYRSLDLLYLKKKYSDSYFWITLKADI